MLRSSSATSTMTAPKRSSPASWAKAVGRARAAPTCRTEASVSRLVQESAGTSRPPRRDAQQRGRGRRRRARRRRRDHRRPGRGVGPHVRRRPPRCDARLRAHNPRDAAHRRWGRRQHVVVRGHRRRPRRSGLRRGEEQGDLGDPARGGPLRTDGDPCGCHRTRPGAPTGGGSTAGSELACRPDPAAVQRSSRSPRGRRRPRRASSSATRPRSSPAPSSRSTGVRTATAVRWRTRPSCSTPTARTT